MALTNYAGNAYQNCTITLYAGTGYTVDHVPKRIGAGTGIHAAYTNTQAKFLTRLGIGVVRVALPSIYADNIDYCCIEYTGFGGTARVLNQPNVTESVIPQNLGIRKGYYFVTGCNALNGGVTEFTIMLDCYTTLREWGLNIASFGGMLTRTPENYDGVTHDYNVLTEPFTPSHAYEQTVTEIDKNDVTWINRWTGSDTASATPEALPIVLSPYNIVPSDSGTIQGYTAQKRSRTYNLEAQTNGQGTITGQVTSGDSGSSSTQSSSDNSTTTTTGTDATEITAAKATAGSITQYFLKPASGVGMNYGVGAYEYSRLLNNTISQLYASDITNAVVDAYSAYGYGLDLVSGCYTSIYGAQGYLTAARPESLGTYSKNNKSTYYGIYVTLVSSGSGQSQTMKYTDCALNSDGSINIDVYSDPTPEGGFYYRIRPNGETLVLEDLTDDFESELPRAMRPGGVKSTEWRKITIATTLGGKGVEAGQAFRLASLDIDSNIARLNQLATQAQYDLTAGDGYLLKNAGNEYGLASLNASMIQNTAAHNIALDQLSTQRIQSAGKSVLAMGVSGASGSIAGFLGAATSGAGALAGTYVNEAQENLNYATQQSQYGTQQRQLTESGEYTRQLTLAQRNAATALAQANVDKLNLTRKQITEAPSIDLLSIAKGGFIQGNNDKFFVIWSYMSEEDRTLLSQTMAQFGYTNYVSVSNALDSDGNVQTPQTWNYYQVDAPGNAYADSLGQYSGVPGWMLKGMMSQITNGIWIKDELDTN